jgi:hypothetical protein
MTAARTQGKLLPKEVKAMANANPAPLPDPDDIPAGIFH